MVIHYHDANNDILIEEKFYDSFWYIEDTFGSKVKVYSPGIIPLSNEKGSLANIPRAFSFAVEF